MWYLWSNAAPKDQDKLTNCSIIRFIVPGEWRVASQHARRAERVSRSEWFAMEREGERGGAGGKLATVCPLG